MEKFDFLGGKITLSYKGETSIKTKFGGIITIIISIILSLLIVGFGNDFFYRTNPTIIRETVSSNNFPVYNLTNKQFPFAVDFEDLNGVPFEDTRALYFEIIYMQYQRDADGKWNVTNKVVDIIPCTEDMFEGNDTFKKYNFQKYLCPNLGTGIIIGGSPSSNFSSSLFFSVKKCEEGKVNFKGEPCLSMKETKDIIDNGGLYLNFYIQKTFITPNNYENGISYRLINEYFTISSFLQKSYVYYFSETIMKTDYGWILRNEKLISIIGLQSKEIDYNLVTTDTLASLWLQFSNERDLYKRDYMKVQTLVANVGGILKLFLTIGQFIVVFHNNIEFDKKILNYCDSNLIKNKNIITEIQIKSQIAEVKDDKNRKGLNKGSKGKKSSCIELENNFDEVQGENIRIESNSNINSKGNNNNSIEILNKIGNNNNLKPKTNLSDYFFFQNINNRFLSFNEEAIVKKKPNNDDQIVLKCNSDRAHDVVNNKIVDNSSSKLKDTQNKPLANSVKSDFLLLNEDSSPIQLNKPVEPEKSSKYHFKNTLQENTDHKLARYEKLGNIDPALQRMHTKINSSYSAMYYMWQKTFQCFSNKYKERIKKIKMMVWNIKKNIDVEFIVKESKFRTKLYEILLSKQQMDGINEEIRIDCLNETYLLNN